MMLDNDLKSRWLRFGLQQVMLCDIYIYIYMIIYICHKHSQTKFQMVWDCITCAKGI